MESAPRTVGNSPVSSPGLFNPTNRRSSQEPEQADDGTYSTPWLHHTHRQAPKETHIADVQADPVSGRKIVNQYEIIDELGRGVHGKVKLGKDLVHGRYVAIKIVDRYSKRRRLGKNNSHEDKIKREIAILKKARHPNIVSLLEVIDDPAKKKVYIVLEHVELGEVKWRTEGAREICLVEWRRFKRESEGIFDNDSATLEDERIIRIAHQKLARQQRRMAREAHLRRKDGSSNQPWSLEFATDSEDEYSDNGRSSQASHRDDDRPLSRVQFRERPDVVGHHEDHMETAFRSPEPVSSSWADGLEGTMYGPYDTELIRGRVPSVAGSSSSRVTDPGEEIPEHFNYVPLMTIHAAWEAFKDTVLGIEYLHYQNVIHRDIKPANLLVTREHRIKISDFGVSYLGRQKTDESNGEHSESDYQEVDEAIELAKTVGTPAFYAPELCRTEIDAETPLIDGGIDIWALGVTLYCLIYGRVPFHDTNTFTLMKVISEDEPYIPRYRLKPVAEQSNSRPNSHGRNSQPMMSTKRAPHDLEYEEVDENLRDLLRRLLIKDARRRITIPEIKRHPWLLSGIPNHISWAEETDPSKSYDGRRIQISKEDVEEAVVPIGFVDRLRSAAKKTSEFVKGFTTRSSGSRRRAQSSATNQDTPPNISANSSSSTISQDARPYEGRRGSLAPGAILEILTRSREAEHPLSHSVTASPEARERSKYFDSPNSRTASPAQNLESQQRPQMQDRALSSISTIRQADLHPGRSASPGFPPALPGTPTALDTPGGSQLGGLFGGLPRRVVNSMRSKDKLKPPKEHSRARSIDRLVGGDDDAHGVPSLAISTTCASGQVNQPDALKDMSPIARSSSPSHSEAQSFGRLDPSSRQSSLSSLSSRLHRNWATANNLEVGPTLGMAPDSRPSSQLLPAGDQRPVSPASIAREKSDDRFDRAKDEYRRRLGVEQSVARERSNSATHQRPSSSHAQTACPPSPDDEIVFRQQNHRESWHRNDQSSENSPLGGSSRGLALSSSEDQFSAMSQSESNPSIPSVASSGSPTQRGCGSFGEHSWISATAANQLEASIDDTAGYDGDHAIESDETDSDEELIMDFGKKKSIASSSQRSNSVSNGELARASFHVPRTTRSGSNGTVKKIPPPELEPAHDRTAEAQ
jgi:serine/threonine protein kinase